MIIPSPWTFHPEGPDLPALPAIAPDSLLTAMTAPSSAGATAPPIATAPAAAAPPLNPGNVVLDTEANLYRRAIRAPKTTAKSTATVDPSHIPFLITGAGAHTIIAASGGFRIAVYMAVIYNGGDEETIRILDGTQDLMGPLTLLGGGVGLLLGWSDHPYFVLQPGNALTISMSDVTGVAQVSGFFKFRMLENYPN